MKLELIFKSSLLISFTIFGLQARSINMENNVSISRTDNWKIKVSSFFGSDKREILELKLKYEKAKQNYLSQSNHLNKVIIKKDIAHKEYKKKLKDWIAKNKNKNFIKTFPRYLQSKKNDFRIKNINIKYQKQKHIVLQSRSQKWNMEVAYLDNLKKINHEKYQQVHKKITENQVKKIEHMIFSNEIKVSRSLSSLDKKLTSLVKNKSIQDELLHLKRLDSNVYKSFIK